MHCKIDGEIALNLFSIFTVYNTCNAIYIYSQFLFMYICNSSVALTFITLIENTLQQTLSVSRCVGQQPLQKQSEHTSA